MILKQRGKLISSSVIDELENWCLKSGRDLLWSKHCRVVSLATHPKAAAFQHQEAEGEGGNFRFPLGW